ncbi:hypothetical protein [Methanohalophilus sp.]|uniref:hypothetical protein n=1 Tax=Methanohalophilus sp. TaxID=1966352 RepID=UPI00260DE5EB|nr:hypothetical protein [Methanohalophilus sp.]
MKIKSDIRQLTMDGRKKGKKVHACVTCEVFPLSISISAEKSIRISSETGSTIIILFYKLIFLKDFYLGKHSGGCGM